MINRIQKQILALLATNSTTTKQGGAAYATGWTGVKNVSTGDTATAGYVNLHKSREKSESVRPAVYCGTQGYKIQERQYNESVNSVGVQYMTATLPLVLVCKSATGLTDAEAQVEQLAANVTQVLMTNRVASGYWMCLTVKGLRMTESGTGGSSSDTSEGRGILEIEIIYSKTPTSPA